MSRTAREFETWLPDDRLAAAVHEFWQFRRRGVPAFDTGLPKPFVELIFNFSKPFEWRRSPGAATKLFGRGWLTPLQDGPRQARPLGDYDLFGARLYPAAAVALFGRQAISRDPVRFEDLKAEWVETIHSELIACPVEKRGARLGDALAPRVAAIGCLAPEPFLREVETVEALAGRLGMPRRDLHRVFARDMGISPKKWLRLRRFDAALRDVRSSAEKLVDVAVDHSFADQAHMTREFRRLAGAPPRVLRLTDHGQPPHFLAENAPLRSSAGFAESVS